MVSVGLFLLLLPFPYKHSAEKKKSEKPPTYPPSLPPLPSSLIFYPLLTFLPLLFLNRDCLSLVLADVLLLKGATDERLCGLVDEVTLKKRYQIKTDHERREKEGEMEDREKEREVKSVCQCASKGSPNLLLCVALRVQALQLHFDDFLQVEPVPLAHATLDLF